MFFMIKREYVTGKYYSINLCTEEKLCSRSGSNRFLNTVYMIYSLQRVTNSIVDVVCFRS